MAQEAIQATRLTWVVYGMHVKHLRGGCTPSLRSVDGIDTSAPQNTVTGIAGHHLALHAEVYSI